MCPKYVLSVSNGCLSASKTKSMCFGPASQNENSQLMLDNKTLERVREFNYLGVTIDDKLSFDTQRRIKKRNVNFKVHQMAKIRKYLDVPGSVKLFKSKILPIFDYADITWDNHKRAYAYELQLIQNRALRIAYKVKLEENPTHTTVELQRLSGCKVLEDRRDVHLLIYAFDIRNNHEELDIRPRHTRLQLGVRYIERLSRNPVVQASFHKEAIRRWNKLKVIFTNIEDKETFKNKIKVTYPTCYINDRYIILV